MSRPDYNEWCEEFRFGSMYRVPDQKRSYQLGEFNSDKFIKYIKNYGTEQKHQSSIWSESLKWFRSLLA
jgi:hypothetical protein